MNKQKKISNYCIKKIIKFLNKNFNVSFQKITKQEQRLLFFFLYIFYRSNNESLKSSKIISFIKEHKHEFQNLFLTYQNEQLNTQSNDNISYCHINFSKVLDILNMQQINLKLISNNHFIFVLFQLLKKYYEDIDENIYFSFIENFLVKFYYFTSQTIIFEQNITITQKIHLKLFLINNYTYAMQFLFKKKFNEFYLISNKLISCVL